MLTIIFFVQFIATWFEHYSKAFAGDRFDKVSSTFESKLKKLYYTKIVKINIDLLSELFMVGLYMGFFYNDFFGLKTILSSGNKSDGILYYPCMGAFLVKQMMLIIEMK